MIRAWLAGALLLGATVAGTGCAGRALATEGAAGGNLLALTARHAERADRLEKRQRRVKPLAVLIERDGIRALDVETATERWSSSLEAEAHPAANTHAVFVPLSGHRLAALDRYSGELMWRIELPGEALSGIAANGSTVVVTVVDHDKGRSAAVGISALDGNLRWKRRSDVRLGAPAVVGKLALVPIGNQLVALGTSNGWERARLDVESTRRAQDEPLVAAVRREGDSLLAGAALSWVDLGSSTGGELDALEEIEGYGQLFTQDDGLDAGHTDAERLRLWVDMSASNAGHRNAVFVCRRAVMALRIDEHGAPAAAQWTYLSEDAEFVGFEVREDRVVLVREDGEIVQVSRENGAELDRIAGGRETRGALLLDLPERMQASAGKRPNEEARLAMMRDLLLDTDPRLLPAQQLTVELLWNDDNAAVRGAVEKIARGTVRGEGTAAAQQLRAHALDRLAEPWGRPDEAQIAALRTELAARPAFLEHSAPAVGVLARRAVAAGDASMIGDLVELLLHPSTDAGDLDAVVQALGELGTDEALTGVATFLRRYHADDAILNESTALTSAVDVLVHAGARATALEEIVADPFTEPALRDYIAARLPTMKRAPERDDEQHNPPELASLSTPRL